MPSPPRRAAGQAVKVFPVDRRDEDDGELADDLHVGLVRLLLQLCKILQMRFQVARILHRSLGDHGLLVENLRIAHEVIEKLLMFVADAEHKKCLHILVCLLFQA